MEKVKTAQEQKYDGVIFRLNNLMKDKEIEGPEYENIRTSLNSILTTFTNEFKIGQNNSELVHRLENQLLGIDESKLQDSRFESFRSATGTLLNIFNHDIE